jgi:hypothetical protein
LGRRQDLPDLRLTIWRQVPQHSLKLCSTPTIHVTKAPRTRSRPRRPMRPASRHYRPGHTAAQLRQSGAHQALVEDRKVLRDFRENTPAKRYFGVLTLTCCPRCATPVTDLAQARAEKGACSRSCQLRADSAPDRCGVSAQAHGSAVKAVPSHLL